MVASASHFGVIDVTGTVTDATGDPLSGVTVTVKGTTLSTVTDDEGFFRINVPDGSGVLVISYLGYHPQEVDVRGRTRLVIVLEQANSSLDEVVVVGYGTVKRRDLTGAVSTVKAEDIALSPVMSPMEALQGRVSGLDIQRPSGRAGQSPNVLLRGNRSLTASQNPLYIVDGIPMSINDVNPNDIESIDVLKDASSTSIYGSSGANGVIMITTKKAKAGRVTIDVNSYLGLNGFASFPKPLMGEQWLEYHRDRYRLGNDGVDPTNLSEMFTPAGVAAIEAGQWVDWVDEALQVGRQQNHTLSVRGGTEKTQAYLSLGFIGEKGVYPNDNVDVYNARGGVDVAFSDMFKAGFQSILNYRVSNSTNSRINRAYSEYPLGVPYDENGIVNLFPIEGDGSVVSILANNYPGAFANQGRNFSIRFNPYIEFRPIKNLTWRSNFGGSLSNGRSGSFANRNSYNFLTQGETESSVSYSQSMSYSYLWENILTYDVNIASDHDVTLTAITSWADNRNEELFTSGRGLDYDDFLYYNIAGLHILQAYGNEYVQTKRMSYAGRLNYGYKGKYLLQVTNRWDGVSQLAAGNKWSSFPSASVAWRISDEPFMASTGSWLSDMKLRAGYGVSGLASIAPYGSLTETETRTPTANLSLGGTSILPVYVPTRYIANPNLTWERSANTNFGLDVFLFDDRLDFSVEYYRTKTTGILWDRRIPMSSGGYDAKNPYVKISNVGTSENHGWEFTASSRNVVKDDFQWHSSLTFTTARERLVDIDLGRLSVDELISEGLFVGHPVRGVHYTWKKIGIWQLGEEEEAALYGAVPGDIKLQTVPVVDEDGNSDNGVHEYSPDDRMVIGSEVPDFFFGLQNTFRYKGIDLTIFMNGRFGQMIDAQVLGYWGRAAQPETYDYWMPTNPTNDYPAPGSGFSSSYEEALRFVDASYFKIRNITLGYSLPQSLCSRFGISNLRIYGTADNPLIFTKSHLLRDVDPENGGADSFPLFKRLVFGINFSL